MICTLAAACDDTTAHQSVVVELQSRLLCKLRPELRVPTALPSDELCGKELLDQTTASSSDSDVLQVATCPQAQSAAPGGSTSRLPASVTDSDLARLLGGSTEDKSGSDAGMDASPAGASSTSNLNLHGPRCAWDFICIVCTAVDWVCGRLRSFVGISVHGPGLYMMYAPEPAPRWE